MISWCDSQFDELSEREREVLELLSGEGCTNKEIADRLGISPKTAKTHVMNIMHKLGVRNRTEAAIYVIKKEREQEREQVDMLLARAGQ